MSEDVAGAAAALERGVNVLGVVVLCIGNDRERQWDESRFFMSSCLGSLPHRLHRGCAVSELERVKATCCKAATWRPASDTYLRALCQRATLQQAAFAPTDIGREWIRERLHRHLACRPSCCGPSIGERQIVHFLNDARARPR